MEALGIDIGGSGMKAAVVDSGTGVLLSERHRMETPRGLNRAVFLRCVSDLLGRFAWKGPVGCGFPGVMRRGIIHTAVNLSADLVGFDLEAFLNRECGATAAVINDADAAGVAEIALGAGRGVAGVVLVLTVGTGIGTAVFVDGRLVPNLEFGHLILNGRDAEKQISSRTRKEEGLSWKEWAVRFNRYLAYVESLLQPDLIILGGGGAKRPERFMEFLRASAPMVPAAFGNRAGIVGAAMAAVRAMGGGRAD